MMNRQPKALYLLNFVSMWECFSYYGMRALLVLFMIQELGYSDAVAYSLYALYTTLIEFGAVIGGVIADRFLGLRRSIKLGVVTIMTGHLCMAFSHSQSVLILGLGIIITGSSLFRSNLPALLGTFYEGQDPRRQVGYTLYYAGINIGGFLAGIFCSIAAQLYGWHAGFGLAALGMFAGNLALYCKRGVIAGQEQIARPLQRPIAMGVMGVIIASFLAAYALYYHSIVSLFFPFVAILMIVYIFSKLQPAHAGGLPLIKKLAVYVVLIMLFFACEEQLGSTLVVFSERHMARQTPWGEIPSTLLISFNPLIILLFGTLMAAFLQRLQWKELTKIAVSFTLLGSAFCLLYLSSQIAFASQQVPLLYGIASLVILSLGELFIGPLVYSAASELAPKQMQGLVMGVVTLGFSLANLFSGFLSSMMAVEGRAPSLEVYANGFGMIGIVTLGVACLLLVLTYSNKKKLVNV